MHHLSVSRFGMGTDSRTRRFRQRRLALESLEGRCLLATFTTFPVTTGSEPTSITAGPEGSLWFAQPGSGSSNVTPSYIGSISTSGSVSEFELPAADEATFLTAGSDGNIWFTDPLNLAIGQITSSGQVQEFKLPAATVNSNSNGIITLGGITEGPDGNVWFVGQTLGGSPFSDAGNLGIGKITPAGQITEFAVSGTFLGLAGTGRTDHEHRDFTWVWSE